MSYFKAGDRIVQSVIAVQEGLLRHVDPKTRIATVVKVKSKGIIRVKRDGIKKEQNYSIIWWRKPLPPPGAPEAVKDGCVCPRANNVDGKGMMVNTMEITRKRTHRRHHLVDDCCRLHGVSYLCEELIEED